MQLLLHLFAPRSRLGWIIRFPLILSLIVSFALVIEVTLSDGLDEGLADFVLVTSTIAGPFTVLAMGLLQYLTVLNARVTELATTDMLTGLANRRAFFEIAGREAGERPGVLLMLDVDHFKRVNDTYGHAVGDACLRQVASMLQAEVRRDDVVGRLGGEEFAVFLPDTSTADARRIAERLTDGVAFGSKETGGEVRVSVSVGSVDVRPGSSFEQALQRADEALYAAKKAGRARVVAWQARAASMLSGPSPAI